MDGMVVGRKLYASNFSEGSLFEGSVGLWGITLRVLSAHVLSFYIPGSAFAGAHCCRVTYKFAPRGAIYAGTSEAIAMWGRHMKMGQ
jgi:hypothetical protein